MNIFKMRSHLLLGIPLLVILVCPPPSIAESNWAASEANLSLAEFLDLYFKVHLARPESQALNSFSLVSFYPSDHPDSALVVETQTWRDEGLPQQNLRREIRKAGDAMVELFLAHMKLPIVSARWHPRDAPKNYVIRHVRHSDIHETVGVTVNGITEFHSAAIEQARLIVTARGGVWDFRHSR